MDAKFLWELLRVPLFFALAVCLGSFLLKAKRRDDLRQRVRGRRGREGPYAYRDALDYEDDRDGRGNGS